ncbi:hypothetical protein ACHQM5_018631 [Ranunculus cassubicifolius]
MAVSVFKSTSKRGNLGKNSATTTSSSSSSTTALGSISKNGSSSDNLNKKIIRRSRSVSATSRIPNSKSFDDFMNKRDNPLFRESSPDEKEVKNLIEVPSGDRNAKKLEKSPEKLGDNGGLDSRRGRAVSRSSDNGSKVENNRKTMGRSLSRLGRGGRDPSVSRLRREDSESESEKKYSVSTTLRTKSIGKLSPSMRKSIAVNARELDQSNRARNPQTWSSQHSVYDPPSDHLSTDYRDDAVSTSSFSEAEEKTILAFTEHLESFERDHLGGDVGNGGIYEAVRSEVNRAINEIQGDLENVKQRKNLTSIPKTDIPSDLEKPDAKEMVSDIRSEYGAKLKQAQERARKLRADLAVEEHREHEFSRILEEILPEPKNLQTPKPRPRRKTSIERRKMSKRLTEEAFNYFDECVSISTFDGSDFSSGEDPLCNLSLSDPPSGNHTFLQSTGSSTSVSYYPNSHMNTTNKVDEKAESNLSHVDSAYGNRVNSPITKFRFSLTEEPPKMESFIKMFEKDVKKDDEKVHRDTQSRYYDGDYCEMSFPDEKVMLERVLLRNRIESGGFLLCDIWT